MADALLHLGSIRFEQERFAEAEQFEREALAIHLAWYGENHPGDGVQPHAARPR